VEALLPAVAEHPRSCGPCGRGHAALLAVVREPRGISAARPTTERGFSRETSPCAAPLRERRERRARAPGRVSAMAERPSMATGASVAGRRPVDGLWRATAATGVAVVAVGAFGTLGHRGFGRVPFSVPARPWDHSDPF